MEAKLNRITDQNLEKNVIVDRIVVVLINGNYSGILLIHIFLYFFPLFSGLTYSEE